MSRRVDQSMVAVQVETAKQDVSVPYGFALPAGSPPGANAPLVNLLARASDTDLARVTSPFAGTAIVPDKKDDIQPIKGVAVTVDTKRLDGTDYVTGVTVAERGDRSVGPLIVQTKVPVPVTPGDQVSFSGRFAVRQSGPQSADALPETAAGTRTAVQVRVTLWGVSRTEDEYGEETVANTSLLQYSAQLQPVLNSWGGPWNQVTFTIPTVSPATVPAGVTSVHLTVGLIAAANGEPITLSYGMPRKGYSYFPAMSVSIMTLSDSAPLRVSVTPPPPPIPGVTGTVPSIRSRTGWAFLVPTSAKWTTPVPTVEVAVVALPGVATGQTIRIWEWTGSARGALLATIELAAYTRAVRQVTTTTGRVEIESAAATHVEYVCAATWSTALAEQTRAYRYTYTDVTSDVVRISAENVEADLAVHSVRFVSDTAPALLASGRRLRVVSLETGKVVASGTIRGRRIVHDGFHEAQVEVAVHSAWGKLGATECQVAYDRLDEYAPILNALGVRTFIDATEVTGPTRPLPEWGGGFPSYREDALTVDESLLMARNTVSGFVRIRPDDSLEVLSALPQAVVLDVSDVPGQGQASFTLTSEFGSDSGDVVNTIAVQENSIDRDDIIDRSLGSDEVPNDLGYVNGTNRTAEYRDEVSVAAYGQTRRGFPVVRGSGAWADIEADNYGPTFRAWALSILARTATENAGPRAITVPVDSPALRAIVADLGALDAINVRFRGSATVMRIRRITHRISPEKWVVDLRFDVTGDQVHWLPETPVPVLVLGDTDAGTLSRPAPAVIDAGHPDDTITALLDGGNP